MRPSTLLFFLFSFLFSHAQGDFTARLEQATLELMLKEVAYDPSYFRIPYPNGEVPEGKGVCTDVVVRAYRKLGVDLQQLVHEDMLAHFKSYPQSWGLKKPDPNIDHRRVPNLMTFFSRYGQTLSRRDDEALYASGDIVCWDLGSGILHIGLVVSDGNRLSVVHNIGAGQVREDVLFDWPIIGHYRYSGK